MLEATPVTPVGSPPAFRLVDVLGRNVATVRNQSVFSPMASVAIDPVDAARVYFETNGSSLGGSWSSSIRGLAQFGTNAWGALGLAASTRLRVGATHVFTLRAGQLFAVPKTGGTNTPWATVPNAVDLVAVDPEVFVLSTATGPSPLVAVHVTTRAVRNVGSYAGARAIALSATGELLLGTDLGTILRVDPTSGAINSTATSLAGSIRAIAGTRFGTAVYTDGLQVFSELVASGPIHVGTYPILDLATVRTPAASLLPYGDSCALPGTAQWNFDNLPTLGNPAFRFGLRNATPNSTAILCLGAGFTFSSVFGQPLPVPLQALGLGTCRLWADPQLQSTHPVDASGAANVTVPIPPAPTLLGLEFGLQWFASQPGANPAGLVGSEGAAAQIL